MPTAEVITSPGRKPAVGTQPKSKSAAMPKAAGYAGLHQARVSPSSAASAAKSLVPAAKPRCGPSAFDLVKKLKQAEDPEEDEGNFIMPPGSDEEDEEQVALNALDVALPPEQEDSAADYVARVKRDLGLAEDMSAESFAPVTPQVTTFPAQARARSTDMARPWLHLRPPSTGPLQQGVVLHQRLRRRKDEGVGPPVLMLAR